MKWLIGVLIGVILLLFAALMYSLGQNVAPVPEPSATPTKRPRPIPTPSESPQPLPSPSATLAPGIIPTAFQGHWNLDAAQCGEGADESRLRVGPQRLRFYESVGEVRGLRVKSDREIVVQLAYSGEGDTWLQSNRMTLSPDGKKLTIDGFVRERCVNGEET